MTERNLRVRIGLDTSGMTAAADAAAAAMTRLGAAALAAGNAASAGSERASAAAKAQADAAKSSAVTQESLIRSTAQAAVVAAQEETDAAVRSAAAQVAAAEAVAAAQEAAAKAAALAAAGASESEISAARAAEAAQVAAAEAATTAATAAATEQTAAAERAAAAQIAAAREVAAAQETAATAALPASRVAAAEAMAASRAAVAANLSAAAASSAAAGEVEVAAGRAGASGSLMGLSIAAGAAMAAKAILGIGMDYELNMNILGAVTNSTAGEMVHASEVAKQLGEDITIPGASAADAARAMVELSKAGFTLVQSEEAAKASLQLAASAHIDAAKAAEIQGQALNLFGLAATDASHVADVLANTANAAAGSITDFSYGLKDAGPVANTLGISIDDTATALGMLAKNGVLGSDAGTQLNRMLMYLEKPTKAGAAALRELGVNAWDANGSFVGLRPVIDQLSAAHGRMSAEAFSSASAIAFGAHAMRGAQILGAEGTVVWDQLAAKIGLAGGNAKLATAMMQGLPGAVENVKNNFENLALAIYAKVSPALATMLNSFATTLPAAGAIAGNVFEGMITVVSAFGSAISTVPGPVWATVAAIGAVRLLGGPVSAALTAIEAAVARMGAAMAAVRMDAALNGVSAMTAGMTVAAGNAKMAMSGLLSAVGGPFGVAMGIAAAGVYVAAKAMDEGAHSTADFTAAIDENTGKLKENAQLSTAQALSKSPSLQMAKDLGISTELYTKAVLGNIPAMEQLRAKYAEGTKGQAEFQAAADAANQSVEGGVIVANKSQDQWTQWNTFMNQLQGDQQNFAGTQESVKLALEGSGQGFNDLSGKAKDANAWLQKIEVPKTGYQAIIDLGGAFADGAVSADELKTQVEQVMLDLDVMAGRNGNAEAAQRALNQQLRDYATAASDAATGGAADRAVAQATAEKATAQEALNKAINKYGRDSPEAQKAARDFADATDNVRSKQRDVAATSDALAQKQDDLKRSMIEAGQAAANDAVLHGNLAGAADVTTAAMDKVKKQFIDSQIAAGGEAGAVHDLADKIFGIPKDATTTIIAETGIAGTAIDALRRKIDGINGSTATVTVKVQQVVAASAAAIGQSISQIFKPPGGFTGGNVSAIMGDAPGYAAGGPIMGRSVPANPYVDNLLAYDANGRPLKVRGDEWIINGRVSGALGADIMGGINSGAYGKDFFTGNTYSTSTHNVYHGGMGTGNLEAAVRGLSASLANGASRTTQLAEHLQITNTTSDGTAGLNRVLALMPRR